MDHRKRRQDIREIHTKFDKDETKIDELVSGNNDQVIINELFENRINNVTHVIEQILDSKKYENDFELVEVISLIFYMDLAIDQLEVIEEAIILSKLGLVSEKILNLNEIELAFEILTNQTIFLDNKESIYKIATASIHMRGDTMIYVVEIPQIETRSLEKYLVVTFARSGKRPDVSTTQIATWGNKTWAITKDCLKLETYEICKPADLKDISYRPCIPPLIRGELANCTYTKSYPQKEISVIIPGMMIIQTEQTITEMENSCGLKNHNLNGTYLLVFSNCSVRLNDSVYDNLEISRRTEAIVLPLDLSMNYTIYI